MKQKLTPIPVVYRLMYNRLIQHSYQRKVPLRKAKIVISRIYHIPRQEINNILYEMRDFGLLEVSNCKYITLVGQAVVKPPLQTL